MKKRIFAILAIGALLLTLFGCAANGNHRTVPRGVSKMNPVPSVTPGQYAPTQPNDNNTAPRARTAPRNRNFTDSRRDGYTGRGYRDGFTKDDTANRVRGAQNYNFGTGRPNVRGGVSSPAPRSAPRTSPRNGLRTSRKTTPFLPRARTLPATGRR